MRADREVVLTAVGLDGDNLQFAAEKLRADREVVLAAVGKNWRALQFAAERLPYFTVPKGKMDEFKAAFGKFYDGTRAGTKECLYYGFAAHGNTVHCREGYKNAEGVLAHLGDVKAPLDAAVAMVGKGGLNLAVMGLAAELAKLRGTMGTLGTKFWKSIAQARTHVTIVS